jgi:hypothetical protein
MGFFNLFSLKKETPRQQSGAQFQSDLFSDLSEKQKYAMVTMFASLAAAPASAERTAMAQKIFINNAAMMGITEDMMLSYMQTHPQANSQTVISTLKTISDTNVLEWFVYAGFGIIAVNQNEKACYVFYDWWRQLGYNPDEVDRIVKKVEAICKR